MDLVDDDLVGSMEPSDIDGSSLKGSPNPKLYKTTMCNYYLQGSCKSGAECVFAHGTNELRDFRTGQLLSELKDPSKMQPKTVLCNKFMSSGFCSYRDQCHFAHGTKDLACNQIGKHQTGMGPHLLYKTTLCKNFLANNSCTFGIKCQFAHGHHELRTSTNLIDNIENRFKRPAEFDDGPGPAKRGATQVVKREMCKHGDQCLNRPKCTYAHHPSELGTIAIVEQGNICKHFERTGTCLMGQNCKFEHRRTKYKTVMCRDIQLRSICPRGQACSFAHSESEISGYSHPQRPSVPPPHHQQSFPRAIVPPSSSGSDPYRAPAGFTSEWSGLSSFSGSTTSSYNNSHQGYTTQGGFGFPSNYNTQPGQDSQGGSDNGSFSFLNRRNNNYGGNTTSSDAYNFKTVMCRNFEKTRMCPRGSECSYAHGENELRK